MAEAEHTRDERRKDLLRLWASRGREQVLSLFHQSLPPGQRLEVGMSIFDIILDHEYGPSPRTADDGHSSAA